MNANCQPGTTSDFVLHPLRRFFRAGIARGLLGLLSVVALLAGCAHAPVAPRPGVEARISFRLPFERVWSAVAQEAAGLDPKSKFDLASGTVETGVLPVVQPPFPFSEYALNPFSSDKPWSNSTCSVNFLVNPIAPDNVTVDVTCVFFRYNTSDDAWHRWPSTGRMEQGIIARLRDRLPAKVD